MFNVQESFQSGIDLFMHFRDLKLNYWIQFGGLGMREGKWGRRNEKGEEEAKQYCIKDPLHCLKVLILTGTLGFANLNF